MATEPETPSPDVMEVWREARKAWRSGSAVVRDEETHSVKIGDSQAAATVIAEAKARWLAEKDAEIARLRESMAYAAMYLKTGFIECSRCGHEVKTKHTDAEYELRATLKEPRT